MNKILIAGRRIARTSVSAIQRRREASEVAKDLNAVSEKAGIGILITVDGHGVTHWREQWPGALRAALETDRGVVGYLLRHYWREGWFSPSPAVRERLTYETQRDINSAHKKWRDSKRNVHAYVMAEREYNIREEDQRRLWQIVANGQKWIDRSIVEDGSCRDVVANVPAIMPIVPRESYLAALVDMALDAEPKRVRAPKKARQIRVLARSWDD